MKKVYRGIIEISRETEEYISKILQNEPSCADECMGEDETMVFTTAFPNGRAVDVKICGVQYREGEDNRPWTEAVLFHNGSEVCCTEPGDAFFGTWNLEDKENEYSVIVRREEPKYDVVLYEKPLDEGLSFSEVAKLCSRFNNQPIIPVEFQAEWSTAMGFISLYKAALMSYDYTELENFIRGILEDMRKETTSGEYTYVHEKGEIKEDVLVRIMR